MDILMNLEKYSTRQAMNKRLGNVRSTRKKPMPARISIVLGIALVSISHFQ